jgi:hypothetical protein
MKAPARGRFFFFAFAAELTQFFTEKLRENANGLPTREA